MLHMDGTITSESSRLNDFMEAQAEYFRYTPGLNGARIHTTPESNEFADKLRESFAVKVFVVTLDDDSQVERASPATIAFESLHPVEAS